MIQSWDEVLNPEKHPNILKEEATLKAGLILVAQNLEVQNNN